MNKINEINILFELNELNELVETCKNIAIKAHEGQIRKFGGDKGKDYIVHPARVAARFYGSFKSPNYSDYGDMDIRTKWAYLTAIGWLHDVVEDTDITIEELQAMGLPVEVLYGVKGMTKVEGENYFDFIMRVKENPFAKQVKKADIEDNMMSLKEGSLKDKYRLALYVLNLP